MLKKNMKQVRRGFQLRDNKENCPHCSANLQGDSIPLNQQEFFGATHFGRKIGVSDMRKDRIVEWICPDCNGRWDVEWIEWEMDK